MEMGKRAFIIWIRKYGIVSFLIVALLLILYISGKEEQIIDKDSNEAGIEETSDDTPLIITRLENCSRLYSTQYHFQKIITHEDLQVLRLGNMSVDIPFSDRKIAIPMYADIKAYTDMALFSSEDIRKEESLIIITLPDPMIEVTSCRIDYDQIKDHVSLFGKDYTPKEMENFQRQGLLSITASAQTSGIFEEARLSAARSIVPILVSMGYDERNVRITFKKDKYTLRELNGMINIKGK